MTFPEGVHTGSSPRGRGKLRRGNPQQTPDRLIPARAGKTNDAAHLKGAPLAHPRAGGENPSDVCLIHSRNGSSPRGRGKPGCSHFCPLLGRLIPARAGKTSQSWVRRAIRAAHPRAGGENGACNACWVRVTGSSPRGRGKLLVVMVGGGVVGLIPARAGKTRSTTRPSRVRPAHPRAGGENPRQSSPSSCLLGSSPRGRGKPCVSRAQPYRRRLIPARAGKTRRDLEPTLTMTAHPRAGGENADGSQGELRGYGSSPRGRGKQVQFLESRAFDGLIPARAGKTP